MTLVREIDYGTPARDAATMVTLEIDGKSVTVPAGTSVMRAAVESGVTGGRSPVHATKSGIPTARLAAAQSVAVRLTWPPRVCAS